MAIFLFGMLMLEDGFKLFSRRVSGEAAGKGHRLGAEVARLRDRHHDDHAIQLAGFGDHHLFPVAGLISLLAGVGIIFGANIGTTTGAWLVAGFGLKVNISAYAMPMLAIAIVLVFQKNKYLRGAGFVLAGLGFLFLGIHHMKEGFEAFKDQFDLTRFAMTGLLGLVVYTLIGAAATVVMQSSHATMVLIITALAAGQISYENALALAIGANIGTTITAIIGSMTANYQGKRLALAHLIFNVVTAGVALIFIAPIRDERRFRQSAGVGIPDNDYALKLAVFHTIFNVLGVAIMLPLLHRLIAFLERTIDQPAEDLSKPKYLSRSGGRVPADHRSRDAQGGQAPLRQRGRADRAWAEPAPARAVRDQGHRRNGRGQPDAGRFRHRRTLRGTDQDALCGHRRVRDPRRRQGPARRRDRRDLQSCATCRNGSSGRSKRSSICGATPPSTPNGPRA